MVKIVCTVLGHTRMKGLGSMLIVLDLNIDQCSRLPKSFHVTGMVVVLSLHAIYKMKMMIHYHQGITVCYCLKAY